MCNNREYWSENIYLVVYGTIFVTWDLQIYESIHPFLKVVKELTLAISSRHFPVSIIVCRISFVFQHFFLFFIMVPFER